MWIQVIKFRARGFPDYCITCHQSPLDCSDFGVICLIPSEQIQNTAMYISAGTWIGLLQSCLHTFTPHLKQNIKDLGSDARIRRISDFSNAINWVQALLHVATRRKPLATA
jgi:hypothetical protein